MVRKVVLTGGPCAGKTTLLNLLRDGRNGVIPEAPRIIIKEQMIQEKEFGNGILPWKSEKDFEIFQYNVIELQKHNEDYTLPVYDTYFLDRSLIDVVGYMDRTQKSFSDEYLIQRELWLEEFKQRYEHVFFLEVRPEHQFENDVERKESYSDALELQGYLLKAYKDSGVPMTFLSSSLGLEKRLHKVYETLQA